jgi:hypothetical protein
MNDVVTQNAAAAKCFARDTLQKFTAETWRRGEKHRARTKCLKRGETEEAEAAGET